MRDLKTILGEDSPEINTLRMTVLEDLMVPLTQRDPNLSQFTRGWDNFRRNNRTLVQELFPAELVSELDNFADFTKAIDNTAPVNMKRELSLPRIISVFTVGHSLARGAARRAFGERIASALLDPSREAVVMSEVLGYNPRSPLISPESIQRVAEIEALREDDNGQ